MGERLVFAVGVRTTLRAKLAYDANPHGAKAITADALIRESEDA